MRNAITGLALVAVIMGGCATTAGPSKDVAAWSPTVDPKGINRTTYERDLAECRTKVAANAETNAGAQAKKKGIAAGVGTAALFGAATILTGGIAAIPLMGGAMATSSGALALGGAAEGKLTADAKYRSMLSTCLAGRGYRVLE